MSKYGFPAIWFGFYMSSSRTAITKGKAIGIIVIVIAALIFGGLYFSSGPPQVTASVATSTSLGTVGTPITFTAIASPSSANILSTTWNFGDGSNQTTNVPSTTHTYQNGGRYLIWVQISLTYQRLFFSSTATVSNGAALFPLLIQPNLTPDQGAEASIPVIDFLLTQNPKAPVINVGDTLYVIGGFLEPPSNKAWSIQQYAWDFGNGQKEVVSTSSNTAFLPERNVTASYGTPSIYPVSLTLTTSSNATTFSVTTVDSVAVQSDALPFSLLTSSTGVVNPGVITMASVATGGPRTFDPQICNDYACDEVVANVFALLVSYNGSSTTSFFPYLAKELPTRQNGGISPDFRTYTFQLRDMRFSNGDPITAYDVWFSMARAMAFTGGHPGTHGWIIAQFLIPGVQNGTANVAKDNTWSAAVNSVTYDNAGNTVSFHLNAPTVPELFFNIIAGHDSTEIIDSKYAVSVGAGFNEANWDSYKGQANQGSYNVQMQWTPVASGPYMVQSYTPGQSVQLVPNPYFLGLPGIPKPNNTVIIDYVKTPDTALLMLEDGKADVVGGVGLPPSDLPVVQQLQSKGLVNIYSWATQSSYWYTFNININKQIEALQFGSQFNEPSNYFADLPTRYAWINSFNYQGFLDNILGNKKYGATFGELIASQGEPGMPFFTPPDQIGGFPAQNLNAAKGNFSLSPWHDMKLTVPIVIWAGTPVILASAEEWASWLSQISGGNITAIPVQLAHSAVLGNLIPDQNPMGCYYETWALPDYPYVSDIYGGDLVLGGYFPTGNDWTYENFAKLPPPNPSGLVMINGTAYTQTQVYQWLNGNLTLGNNSVDPLVVARAYKIVELLTIYLGLYVEVYLAHQYWYFRSWLHGESSQENPVYNGVGGLIYYWLTKG